MDSMANKLVMQDIFAGLAVGNAKAFYEGLAEDVRGRSPARPRGRSSMTGNPRSSSFSRRLRRSSPAATAERRAVSSRRATTSSSNTAVR